MDLSWASLPLASDPALAEWLEGASCGPHVKALAVRAADAADAAGRGISAARWRQDLSAADARQAAERILAHDQEGRPT